MSGILGFYATNIEAAKEKNGYSTQKGLETLKLGRNDESIVWGDEQCELVNISSVDGPRNKIAHARWSISYDGEIHNRTQLRSKLEAEGCKFEIGDDIEVLLFSIDTWGIEKTLQMISGVCAFAAYNMQTKDLHIVRDRMGIKPVCYYLAADFLVFASNSASIVNGLTDKKWALNWQAAQNYFMLSSALHEDSFFSGITRLKPAEHIVIRQGLALESQIYWKPALREKLEVDEIISIIQEYAALDESANILLSGGVCSSAISVALKASNVELMHINSIDTKYAQKVASSIGRDCQIIDVKNTDSANERPFVGHGEPLPADDFLGPMLGNYCYNSNLIVGNGADELFLGNELTPVPELNENTVSWNRYTLKPIKTLNKQLDSVFIKSDAFKVSNVDDQYHFEKARSYFSDECFLEGFPLSASHRWIDIKRLASRNFNLPVSTPQSVGTEYKLPYLDVRLVEGALSMNGNDLITMVNGRKSPLVDILKWANISPGIWQRKGQKAVIDDIKLESIKHQQLSSLKRIVEKGIIQSDLFEDQNAVYGPEVETLAARAHSFEHWLNTWSSKLEGI